MSDDLIIEFASTVVVVAAETFSAFINSAKEKSKSTDNITLILILPPPCPKFRNWIYSEQ